MDFWDIDRGIRHDFSRSRDTKATLLELDRTQLDPRDISLNNDESDIALLCSPDTFRNILRHVLLRAKDTCLVI